MFIFLYLSIYTHKWISGPKSKRLGEAQNLEADLKSSCKSEFKIFWVTNRNLNKKNLPVEIIKMTRVKNKSVVTYDITHAYFYPYWFVILWEPSPWTAFHFWLFKCFILFMSDWCVTTSPKASGRYYNTISWVKCYDQDTIA